MAGYRLTLAGIGAVDLPQVVATQAVALGDSFTTDSGVMREPSLSFGFASSTTSFTGTKPVTVVNNGDTELTFTVENEASPQSRPATVTFDRTTVTVPARGSAVVNVTLSAPMASVGSSLTGAFAFFEVSGSVKLTADGTSLRVPYLLVPRADSNVTAKARGTLNPRNGGVPVTFTNRAVRPPPASISTSGVCTTVRMSTRSSTALVTICARWASRPMISVTTSCWCSP